LKQIEKISAIHGNLSKIPPNSSQKVGKFIQIAEKVKNQIKILKK
jgi:hypothetical protein